MKKKKKWVLEKKEQIEISVKLPNSSNILFIVIVKVTFSFYYIMCIVAGKD